jgi:hypothetical protein
MPASKQYLVFIDPPSTKAPLERWKRFLDGMQKFPQSDPVVREELAHAKNVVAWKQAGEQGPAPKRPLPPVSGPDRKSNQQSSTSAAPSSPSSSES